MKPGRKISGLSQQTPEGNHELSSDAANLPLPLEIVENDTELYWLMALELYGALARLTPGESLRCIAPVGPVFQYRRFIRLVDELPIDLAGLHLFFMDEYLNDDGSVINRTDPLSFRGFIDKELVEPLGTRHGFNPGQLYFPDPADPSSYDRIIDEHGGIDVCFAGVGINGHLAFNEAPSAADSPSRVVELSAETRVTNGHTALGGDWESIPRLAVTVGMKSILASRRLRIYCNRPWQRSVVRKLLYGPVGQAFPASFAQNHRDARLTVTRTVAESPRPGLK